MPDDAFDDDDEGFEPPLPPDDRIWRHPSEVGGIVQAARRRREISNAKLIGFAATAGLLGSVITVGALAAGGAFDRTIVEGSTTRIDTTASPPPPQLAGGVARWPDVVQRLAGSLARLEGTGEGNATSGSAVAFLVRDGDTYFVTSLDLLDRVDRVMLVLADGRERRAERAGTDPYTNLAVLKVSNVEITPAPFAPTANPQTGDDAVLIGAPRAGTESPGAAKALIASIGESQRTRTGIEIDDLLRTDANIGADAKGSALVDQDGNVVGLVSVMTRDDAGIERFGYALPARLVVPTATSLVDSGYATQAWMGVSGTDLSAQRAAEISATGLAVRGGAVLGNISVDSPAAECGLAVGDIVVKLNMTEIESMTRLVLVLRERQPTDTVTVEYLRENAAGTFDSQRCFATLAVPREVTEPGDGATASSTTTAPSTDTTTEPPAPASLPPGSEGEPATTAAEPATTEPAGG